MLDTTTDRTTDGSIPDEWQRRSPGLVADPSLIDFAEPAIGAALPHHGPENP